MIRLSTSTDVNPCPYERSSAQAPPLLPTPCSHLLDMSLTLSSPSSPAMTTDTESNAADEKDTPTTTTELDVAPYPEETVPPASPEITPDTEVDNSAADEDTLTATAELDVAPHVEDPFPAIIPNTAVQAAAETDSPTTTADLDVAPDLEDPVAPSSSAASPDTEVNAAVDTDAPTTSTTGPDVAPYLKDWKASIFNGHPHEDVRMWLCGIRYGLKQRRVPREQWIEVASHFLGEEPRAVLENVEKMLGKLESKEGTSRCDWDTFTRALIHVHGENFLVGVAHA